jgi:hypothetical protein
MKIKIIGLGLILTALCSCGNVSSENIENETPQVLDEQTDYNMDYVLNSSLSKRGYSDLISKLYKEALEKNGKLNELNKKINGISELENDSLQVYSKFSETNTEYWSAADSYANRIQDSILRISTVEIFRSLDSIYNAKMDKYEKKIMEIEDRRISLNDQLIVMKLFITEPMIKNYQLNEIPDIKTLESIVDEYDKLIKETEVYTNFSK